MIGKILNEIKDYENIQKTLKVKYKEIEKMFSDNFIEVKEHIEKLSLEEAESFMDKYKYFMNEDKRDELGKLVDSKKNTARYMPVLNELEKFGFSKKKIVKLDEFLERYIEPYFGATKKSETLSLGASGFYSILTQEDKKVLYKFLLDKNIALPILDYYCTGDHSDDDCFGFGSKNMKFKKKDVDDIKTLLEYRAKDDGNQEDEFYEKLEELEDNLRLYCPSCGEEIDLNNVISNYEKLLNGDYCESLQLL